MCCCSITFELHLRSVCLRNAKSRRSNSWPLNLFMEMSADLDQRDKWPADDDGPTETQRSGQKTPRRREKLRNNNMDLTNAYARSVSRIWMAVLLVVQQHIVYLFFTPAWPNHPQRLHNILVFIWLPATGNWDASLVSNANAARRAKCNNPNCICHRGAVPDAKGKPTSRK